MQKTGIDSKSKIPAFKMEIQGFYDKEKITLVSCDLDEFMALRERIWKEILGMSPPAENS